jgi:hypothetical protein
MKKIYTFLQYVVIILVFISCNSKSDINNEGSISSEQNIDETVINDSDNYSDEVFSEDSDSACKYEDGTYSATVDYNNSETGYSATYSLDVEVQDCQIVQINFPNDGYLDDDHISYADIEEDGSASVTGEDGKTYEIQIDN